MSTFLIIIGLFLLLLIVFLAVPLYLSFSFSNEQQVRSFIHVKWMFGLVKFETDFPVGTESATHKNIPQIKKEQPVNKKLAKTNTNTNVREIVMLFKQSEFRRHIVRFIKKLLRASHARGIYLRLRIGLGDPADTGILWAAMGPLSGILNNLRSATIVLEPEFTDPVLDIEGQGRFNLIPLQFIALVIMFLLSPTTMRAWNAVRRMS